MFRRSAAAAATLAALLLAAAAGSSAGECIQNPYNPIESEYPGVCKTCDATNTTCLECFEGYGLMDGTCMRCNEYNCGRCDGDIHFCTNCTFYWDEEPETGFYAADNGICQQCPTPFCRLCHNSNGTCFECDMKYGLVENGTCAQCADQDACMRCDGDTAQCDECSSGFVLVEGKCMSCPKNCDSCSDPQTCTECGDFDLDSGEQGVVLDNTTSQCVLCAIEGCSACPRGANTCDACISTGWTNTTDGGCVRCSDPHCTTCAPTQSDQCQICATFNEAGRLQWGADKVSGKCLDCLAGPNCASCQEDYAVCDFCDGGFITDIVDAGTKCVPCSSITPNCASCTWDATVTPAKQSCDGCADGWVFDEVNRTCTAAT